jgi:diphthine synthase
LEVRENGLQGAPLGRIVALHLVGLGLHDAKSITVRGLETVRAADKVYAEFYTAILTTTHSELEAFLGKPVTHLDRLGVEKGGERLLAEARSQDVVLLVAGDPMAATTHADLLVRFREAGVPIRIVQAPSIFTAAPGLLGLQHYKFGRTTTIAKPEGNWFPTSPFEAIAENHERGLHTLVLLDIKADLEYFMTANEAFEILLRMAEKTGNSWFNGQSQAAVVARAGSDDGACVTGTINKLRKADFGPPLHCIVLPGALHDVEQAAWKSFAVK